MFHQAYQDSGLKDVMDAATDPDVLNKVADLPGQITDQIGTAISNNVDYYSAHPDQLRQELGHFAGNVLFQALTAKATEIAGEGLRAGKTALVGDVAQDARAAESTAQ